MPAFARQPGPTPEVALRLPAKLLPILQPRRFKIMHGGRGGGKSHTVAQVLVMLAMQKTLRILCVREVQKSLRQSSKRVIEDYIQRMGLGAYFKITKDTDESITCLLTGSTFSFSGLKDHTADSIKSFEGADIVWCEEAHSITAHSWTILIPTIRAANSEIWATFNSDSEDDYVYQRFVKNTDPDAWVVQINWRDNPWFGREMDAERRKLKALNDDLYQHVWEGKCRTLAGLLFKRIWFERGRFDLGQQPGKLILYVAGDFAAGADPDDPEAGPDWTEFGVFGVDAHGEVWIVDWYSSQEDPSVYVKAFIGLLRVHKPLAAFEEAGVIHRTLDGYLNRAMRFAKTWVRRVSLNSSTGKAARALSWAGLCASGQVHIPRTEWGERLINQLCAFNGQEGRTDDMVDACSKFAQGLDWVYEAFPDGIPDAPKTPDDVKPGAPKPFTEAYNRALERMDEADDEARKDFYR